jgi:hypothetical protein
LAICFNSYDNNIIKLVSTTSIIFVAVGVAVLGVAAYYTFNLLNEDSPLRQRARSQLGLDKAPSANILKDPRVASYKSDPHFGGYPGNLRAL